MLNPSDLTWEEWLLAAGKAIIDRYGCESKVRFYSKALRRAFLAGEDPTEYRTAEA